MAASSRSKGILGEREVARIWAAAGFTVRGLEGQGDHLIVSRNGRALHSETKWAERWKLPEWLAQTEDDVPEGAAWVLAVKRPQVIPGRKVGRRPRWYGVQLLSEIVAREARIAELEAALEDR